MRRETDNLQKLNFQAVRIIPLLHYSITPLFQSLAGGEKC